MKTKALLLAVAILCCAAAAWAGPRQVYESAYLAAKAGDAKYAVGLYSRAIASGGLSERNLAAAYYNRALAFRKLGLVESAMEDYNMAIKIRPDYAMAYNNRAYLYLVMGNNKQALIDFSSSIQFMPDNAMAHAGRGVAYQRLAMYDYAYLEFTSAILANDQYADAYAQLAWLLATCPVDKYRDGARAFCLASQAVFLSPTAMNFDALAAAYAEVGMFKQAERYQLRALRIMKKLGPDHYYSGFAKRLESYRAGRPWREPQPPQTLDGQMVTH